VSGIERDPAKLFAPRACELVSRADGTMIFRSRRSLAAYPRCMGVYLEQWAKVAPERLFLQERGADHRWQGVTYEQAHDRVRRVAAGLLRLGLTSDRPVMILSDNSVQHALLMFAAMHVGIPSVSVSSAYSLLSSDFAKLRAIVQLVDPGLIFVSDHAAYARALHAIQPLHRAPIVAVEGSQGTDDVMSFGWFLEREDAAAVDAAFAGVGLNTIAKLLFTSGSTGEPKGVINTQRMLVSNQQARVQHWPFLEQSPPIVLDWLPWSHTFGANHNLNMVLRCGGTLYLDAGRPAPKLFAASIANLKDVSPTVYFNVPRGFDMLVAALRSDAELRERFFARLQVIFYAAAALPQRLWDALIELSMQTLGAQVPLVSAWGSTETAPTVTDCHFQADSAGVIGVPYPGTELKLVPADQKLEARVRGPNVTPGYYKRPELTASQFDAEGFYKIGDAVRLLDPEQPERGLLFDGRLAEDFKLDTGTWVHVSTLRLRAIAALEPIAQDVVIAGHNCSTIGLLIFPNAAACTQLCGDSLADAPIATVLAHAKVRARVAAGLTALAGEAHGASSLTAAAALLMAEPPSPDAGEITDKGYINQRAVLERRNALVSRLYDPTAQDVIRLT